MPKLIEYESPKRRESAAESRANRLEAEEGRNFSAQNPKPYTNSTRMPASPARGKRGETKPLNWKEYENQDTGDF
jgi:hypothetical protein